MATVDKYPMLAEGHAELMATLRNLKEVERPKNVEDIETARASLSSSSMTCASIWP